jgi:hypothetical protein
MPSTNTYRYVFANGSFNGETAATPDRRSNMSKNVWYWLMVALASVLGLAALVGIFLTVVGDSGRTDGLTLIPAWVLYGSLGAGLASLICGGVAAGIRKSMEDEGLVPRSYNAG